MADLYFSGDQVAYFMGIDDATVGGEAASQFTGVYAPFLATDLIIITVRDQDIDPDGEFSTSYVGYTSITVIRDGVAYDLYVNPGSKIKETGGSNIKEQGDNFLTTNDSVGPAASGPFSTLPTGKLVFSTTDTFQTGVDKTIVRNQTLDLNNDGDTTDTTPREQGNANFNVTPVSTMPCFVAGTMILTPDGERPIESLSEGDFVTLASGGVAPILVVAHWQRVLQSPDHPMRPIRVSAGALGPGLPTRDLALSPQHGLLAGATQLCCLAVPGEALVRARALTGLRGVRVMRGCRAVRYHTVMLNRHALIMANGAIVESFYPGRLAMMALPQPLQQRLEAEFPGLRSDVVSAYGPPIRRVLAGGRPGKCCLAAIKVRHHRRRPERLSTAHGARGIARARSFRRAVTSISIFISGFCNPARIIVAAGRASANAALTMGQQGGQSLALGRM